MLLPALLIYYALPYCFDQHTTTLYVLLERLSQVYIAFSSMMLVSAFLKNITKVAIHELEEHHLVGILQFLRLLTFCLVVIIMVSSLLGNNPLRVIAGLGAAATVLMLVFKDSILGLVAGIQLSMNNMLKGGDWVTIQKLGIDGTVEEVSLTTVKVRNFDNTISTVSTLHLGKRFVSELECHVYQRLPPGQTGSLHGHSVCPWLCDGGGEGNAPT